MFSRQLQRCCGKKKQKWLTDLALCIYREKRQVFPSPLRGHSMACRCPHGAMVQGRLAVLELCDPVTLHGADPGPLLPAVTGCGSAFTFKGSLSWLCPLCSPLSRSAEARCCRAWGAPDRERRPGQPGCSGTEGLAQEELEAPGGMQPHVPGGDPNLLAPAQPSSSSGLRLAAFSALTSLRGQPWGDPWGGTEAGPRQRCRLGCWALTLPASASSLFLSVSLSLSPFAFSRFPAEGFQRCHGPWAEPASLPDAAVPTAASARTWHRKSTEKTLQKRQNTETLPGDFHFFPFFSLL